MSRENTRDTRQDAVRATPATKYKDFELYDEWTAMPPIPRDHVFKTIPLSILDRLGWRWDAAKNAYYIPYFSETRQSLPFVQWRFLSGNIRFNFLREAKPTVYGKWNLTPGGTYFLVEGTSDCAALEYCHVPWIGLPSASSGELVRGLAKWAVANHVRLVYAGDNDEAGNKLREALDEVMSYRTCQPPRGHKDWADFLSAEGIEAVTAYCRRVLGPMPRDFAIPDNWDDMTDVQKIQAVWPGAEELQIV